jgi:hypothetical protein
VQNHRFKRERGLALGTVWFFVLLLALSAPHRVHHLFEGLGVSPQTSDDAARAAAPHGHPEQNSEHDNPGHEHDHNSRGSAKADCTVQAVTQNFHVAPEQAIAIDYRELESQTQPAVTLSWHYHFRPSPFSQRAPPRA